MRMKSMIETGVPPHDVASKMEGKHIHTKREQNWRTVSVGKAGHVSSCEKCGAARCKE